MQTPNEPHPALAKKLDISSLFFKREDLHPYGSHKGRSIPFMIDHYYEKGDRSFALSSSGNAALAAALHARKLRDSGRKIGLDIFVGQHIAPAKLKKLQALATAEIRVLQKERPLQGLTAAIDEGARSLRQSTDDVALTGYRTLAEELSLIPDLGAVFVGTSSGTTAEALAKFFIESGKPVQVHVVQTSSCHPISAAFEEYDGPDEKSVADAIVDLTAKRKPALVPLVKKSGGHGWFATNDDIEGAIALSEKHAGFSISPNSALSLVGAMQAAYRGWEFGGAVACLIGGE